MRRQTPRKPKTPADAADSKGNADEKEENLPFDVVSLNESCDEIYPCPGSTLHSFVIGHGLQGTIVIDCKNHPKTGEIHQLNHPNIVATCATETRLITASKKSIKLWDIASLDKPSSEIKCAEQLKNTIWETFSLHSTSDAEHLILFALPMLFNSPSQLLYINTKNQEVTDLGAHQYFHEVAFIPAHHIGVVVIGEGVHIYDITQKDFLKHPIQKFHVSDIRNLWVWPGEKLFAIGQVDDEIRQSKIAGVKVSIWSYENGEIRKINEVPGIVGNKLRAQVIQGQFIYSPANELSIASQILAFDPMTQKVSSIRKLSGEASFASIHETREGIVAKYLGSTRPHNYLEVIPLPFAPKLTLTDDELEALVMPHIQIRPIAKIVVGYAQGFFAPIYTAPARAPINTPREEKIIAELNDWIKRFDNKDDIKNSLLKLRELILTKRDSTYSACVDEVLKSYPLLNRIMIDKTNWREDLSLVGMKKENLVKFLQSIKELDKTLVIKSKRKPGR